MREAIAREADDPGVSSERRVHRRQRLVASAVVWTSDGGPMRYLVDNLSVGGALLTGGPLLSLGQELRLTLQLDKHVIGPLRAQVVRRDGLGGEAAGIAFAALTVAQEDALQQASLDALEAEVSGKRAQRALVVDDSAHVRQSLMRDLVSLGHSAIAAATPLEAMMRLEDPLAEFDVVLVDLCSKTFDGLALLRYLAEHHPSTRRVLMSGDVRPDQLKLARLTGQADDVLPKPWDKGELSRVCGGGTGRGGEAVQRGPDSR
jgi:CheY-like chemotaxis protein